MATLTKDARERSPYWICCYNAADGRRLKKSTKQTDRTKALEVCLALERAEGMAAQGTLTETRARELIGEVLERTNGVSLPFYTTEGWLRDWLHGRADCKWEAPKHCALSREAIADSLQRSAAAGNHYI